MRAAQAVSQNIFPCPLPPIIVASMGRSGSTLVYTAVSRAIAAERFLWLGRFGGAIVSDSAWDLGEKRYEPGVVYKTHGLAHELPAGAQAKVIFLFGPASDAALSVLACKEKYGQEWIDLHFDHLRATGTVQDLSSSDVLRFEEQVDGWRGKDGVERLILRYDAIWDHAETLSEFVGCPVKLPVRRARSGVNAAPREEREQFLITYARLDEKFAALPPCEWLR